MSEDRTDQRLRQAFKERALALDADNRQLRESLDTAFAEIHRLRLQSDSHRAECLEWRAQLEKERAAVTDLTKRNAELSEEFEEAIQINAQLTAGINEMREISKRDAAYRADLELRCSTTTTELSDARDELAALRARSSALLTTSCEKDSAFAEAVSQLDFVRRELDSVNHAVITLEERVSKSEIERKLATQLADDECQRNDKLIELLSTLQNSLVSVKSLLKGPCAAADEAREGDTANGSRFVEVDGIHAALLGAVASLEQSVRACLAEKEVMTDDLSSLRDRLVIAEETVLQQTRQIEAMECCSQQMVTQRIELEQSNIEHEKKVLTLEVEVQTLQSALSASKVHLERTESEFLDALNKLRTAIGLPSATKQTAVVDVEDITTCYSSQSDRMDDLSRKISACEAQLSQQESDLVETRRENESLKTSRERSLEELSQLKTELVSVRETNVRLTQAASECQRLLSLSKEEGSKQIQAKKYENDGLRERLSHYESELGMAVKELQQAKAIIESHKKEAQQLIESEEAQSAIVKQHEGTITALRKELDLLRRQFDAKVLQITELEERDSKRQDERRITQIEMLQLRSQLRKEQEEVKSLTEMHQNMREAFENRARQNQEIVDATDARAASLEGELSEVISKYNSLAQTHKELRIRHHQLTSELEEVRNSNASSQTESEVASRQRRMLYELNLRLSEQETVVRDLSAANRILCDKLSALQAQGGVRSNDATTAVLGDLSLASTQTHRAQRGGVISVQPLNINEGPIRHPKKLRVDLSGRGVN